MKGYEKKILLRNYFNKFLTVYKNLKFLKKFQPLFKRNIFLLSHSFVLSAIQFLLVNTRKRKIAWFVEVTTLHGSIQTIKLLYIYTHTANANDDRRRVGTSQVLHIQTNLTLLWLESFSHCVQNFLIVFF